MGAGAGAGAGFGAELGSKAFPAAGVGTSSSSKASNGDAIVCRRKEFATPRFLLREEKISISGYPSQEVLFSPF